MSLMSWARRNLTLLAVVGVLQVADLITTHRALSLGGVEANPLGRAALGGGFGGLVAMKVVMYGLCGLAVWAHHRRGMAARAFLLLGGVSLFYCLVVGSNLVQLAVYT